MALKLSYDKLWIKLIEEKLTKQELRQKAGFSCGTLTKMNREEPVKIEILLKICEVLKCDIGDICAAVPAET